MFVEWSNLWVIWVSLCHEFVKSDDLEHYGLNKKAPNTVQDAATAQGTFVFFLRVPAPRTVIVSAVNLCFSTCLLRTVYSVYCYVFCAAGNKLFKIHYFY